MDSCNLNNKAAKFARETNNMDILDLLNLMELYCPIKFDNTDNINVPFLREIKDKYINLKDEDKAKVENTLQAFDELGLFDPFKVKKSFEQILDVVVNTFSTESEEEIIIRQIEKVLGGTDQAKQEIADVLRKAKNGLSFEEALKNQESIFTKEEIEKIKKALNGKNLEVKSVSRQTDPAFFSKEIVEFLKENAKKDFSDPTRINVIELWTKHDGLPIRDILEACKKYKVAPMVSFSITGMGGTAFEGGVMKYMDLLTRIEKLIKNGTINPVTTTIRIDPILPHVTNMEDIKKIVEYAKTLGIKKFVTSITQSYGYTVGTANDRKVISGINDASRVEYKKDYDWEKYYGVITKEDVEKSIEFRKRFLKEHPEFENSPKLFHVLVSNAFKERIRFVTSNQIGKIHHTPKFEYVDEIGNVLLELNKDKNIEIESCSFTINGLKSSACLDPLIIERLTGIDIIKNGVYDRDTSRPDCMCYGTHVDIFRGQNKKCASSCAYCYATHSSDNKLNYYEVVNGEVKLKDNRFTQTEYSEDDLSSFVLNSGGAIGSDNLWGDIARKYGIQEKNIKHWWFGDKTPFGNIEQSKEDNEEGITKVKKAAEDMGRFWSSSKEKQNLLARNWNQVKYSDAIFAIGTMNLKGSKIVKNGKTYDVLANQISGGTGYAVQMAINEGKPVYVYDYKRKIWLSNINGQWKKNIPLPVLTKNFAGIGTRDIKNVTDDEKIEIIKVIESVFDNTKKYAERYKEQSSEDIEKILNNINYVNITNNVNSTEISTSDKETTLSLFGSKSSFKVNNQKLVDAILDKYDSNKPILLRCYSDNNIITANIDKIERNDDGTLTIEVVNINKSVYNKDILKEVDKFLKNRKDKQLTNTKPNEKRKIKFKYGTDFYNSRVEYISRLIKKVVKSVKKDLINEEKINSKTKISEVFNFVTPKQIKEEIERYLNKDITSPEQIDKDMKVFRKYNLFNNDEELRKYTEKVNKKKKESNEIIRDNFEEFFEDALKDFASYYGLVISENKVSEQNEEDFSQQGDEKQENDKVKDKEYDNKAHWQIEIKHMMDTASEDLRNFLSSIPKQDAQGKLILNDIGEVQYINTMEVYDTLQSELKDCFTWSEMEKKLEILGKKNADYKYVLDVLNREINKNGKIEKPFAYLKNEIFTLFTTEEIFYSTYYSKNSQEDEKEAEALEMESPEPEHGVLIKKGIINNDSLEANKAVDGIENNVFKGIALYGENPLNTLKTISDFKKRCGDLLNLMNGNVLLELERFNSDEVRNVTAYLNSINHHALKGLDTDICRILNEIGYKISKEDVYSAITNLSGETIPALNIVVAIRGFLNEAKKYNSLKDMLDEILKGVNSEDEKKRNKYLAIRKQLFDNLKNIAINCPVTTNIKRNSTIYVNNNLYPKFKALSFFGKTIKYIKTDNFKARNKWVFDNFRNIDWYYDNGNIKLLSGIFNKIKDNTVNVKLSEVDKKICDNIYSEFLDIEEFKDDIEAHDENYNNIEKYIDRLSIEAKSSIIALINNEFNNGIERYSDLLLIKPHWKNEIIGKLIDGDKIYRQSLKRERVLSFNKKDVDKWTSDDFQLIAIEKYFSYKNKKVAEFLVPNYSDAGVVEYVTLPKSGNIEECINSLYNSFIQETQRIRLIKERTKFRHAVYDAYNLMIDYIGNRQKPNISNPILQACFDDFMEYYNNTGKIKSYYHNNFFSYPIQNLEDIEKIEFKNGKLKYSLKKSGRGNNYQFFSFIDLNEEEINNIISNEDKPFDDNFKVIIKQKIYAAILKEGAELAHVLQKNSYILSRFTNTRDESRKLYYDSSDNEDNIYAKKNIYNEDSFTIPDTRLLNFIADNMCANLALTELLVVDMAQYKDAVDFQKRFKEVYAGTKRVNTEYDEISNKYAKKEDVMFEVTDAKFNKAFDILNVLEKAKISQEQKDFIRQRIVSEYEEVNGTDGQSLRTLESFRALMSMSNEWIEELHGKLFDKLQNHKPLTNRELEIFINPRKPFVYTTRIVNSKTFVDGNNVNMSAKNMRIGYQIKNSEFLMMYLYSQVDTTRDSESALMYAFNKFAVENGIDVIHYNSAIKVGGQAPFNSNELPQYNIRLFKKYNFENEKSYLKAINKAIEDYAKTTNKKFNVDSNNNQVTFWAVAKDEDNKIKKDSNGNVIYTDKAITWDSEKMYNYIVEQERKRIINNTLDLLYDFTQIQQSDSTDYNERRNNTISSANLEVVKIIPTEEYGIISNEHEHYNDRKQKIGTQLVRLLTADNAGKIKVGDKEYNNNEIFNLVTKILLHKTKKHWKNVDELIKDKKKLIQYLKEVMLSDSKYSEAMINAIQSVDEEGKPNMLGDEAIRNMVESILNSFIRREINDIKLDGGTCTQVTAVGTDNLSVIYDVDEEGKPYIKYWEAIAPMPFKSLLKRFMNNEGMLDINLFNQDSEIDTKTKEHILKLLGCRIPTESKHSIQHIKIVNFSAPQNGSVIFLPYEITKTSGADFDIDHLYIWRYSFDWVTKEREEKYEDKKTKEIKTKKIKYKIPVYSDYHTEDDKIPENLENLSENQLNNYLIDVFWAVLQNPDNLEQELTPNGFDTIKKAGYVAYLLNNYQDYLMEKYNIEKAYNLYELLNKKSLDELSSLLDVTMNRLGLSIQVKFFIQNALGKGLLGTMAVNNVFLSLLQHINISINPEYIPVIKGYSNNNFSEIYKKDKTLLSSIIMEMLGAAPDSAKDPVLMYMGLTKHTQNAIIAAALLGYDPNSISLLFNNIVVRKFFEDYFNEDETIYPEKLARRINEYFVSLQYDRGVIYTENVSELKEVQYNGNYIRFEGNKSIIKDKTSWSIKNDTDLISEEKELSPESMDLNKTEILIATVYKFFCIGNELHELSTIIRQDSTTGTLGTSVSDIHSKKDKITAISNKMKKTDSILKGNFVGYLNYDNVDLSNPNENPLGFVGTQYYYGIYKALEMYYGLVPETSEMFISAKNYLNKILRDKYADTELLETMTTEYLKFHLYQTDFFGGNNNESTKVKASKIVNNLWKQINAIKQLYPELTNNVLLKALELNTNKVVVLPDAGRIKDEDKKAITNSWEELLNSPYDKVRQLGYDLIRYSFYRNNLKFAPDGFGHLCPDIRVLIPDFKEAIQHATKSIEDGNNFFTQFLNNFAEKIRNKSNRIKYRNNNLLYYNSERVMEDDVYGNNGITLKPNTLDIKGSEGDFTIYDNLNHTMIITDDTDNMEDAKPINTEGWNINPENSDLVSCKEI